MARWSTGTVFRFLVVALIAWGCKARLGEDSGLKHAVGATSVPRTKPPEDCHRTPFDPEVPSKSPANLYIEKIMRQLLAKNATVFTGFLSPDYFCARVNSFLSFGATGNPFNALVDFNAGTILRASSDADVAAAMAHELAHISLNQIEAVPTEGGGRDVYADEIYKVWAKTAKDIDEETTTIFSMINDVNAKVIHSDELTNEILFKIYEYKAEPLRSLVKYIDPSTTVADADLFKFLDEVIEDAKGKAGSDFDGSTWVQGFEKEARQSTVKLKLLKTIAHDQWDELQKTYFDNGADLSERVANDIEALADEVGYELYLKAGFAPSAFHNLFLSFMAPNERQACLESIANAKRGERSHPTDCWRLVNIMNEDKVHAGEYKSLLAEASHYTVEGIPTLKEAQDSLKSLHASECCLCEFKQIPGYFGTNAMLGKCDNAWRPKGCGDFTVGKVKGDSCSLIKFRSTPQGDHWVYDCFRTRLFPAEENGISRYFPPSNASLMGHRDCKNWAGEWSPGDFSIYR